MENNLLDFNEFKNRKELNGEKEITANAIKAALALTAHYFKSPNNPKDTK